MTKRLHFFANGIFSTSIAGGDIHFLKLAESAVLAGYDLNFFGGHALQEVLRKHRDSLVKMLADVDAQLRDLGEITSPVIQAPRQEDPFGSRPIINTAASEWEEPESVTHAQPVRAARPACILPA